MQKKEHKLYQAQKRLATIEHHITFLEEFDSVEKAMVVLRKKQAEIIEEIKKIREE